MIRWPMAFPAQACRACGEPVRLEDGIVDVDVEGKYLGVRHPDCYVEVER